ncbi:MAG TPA: hypothetical protein VFF20_04460 [Pseudogracilibacillus sp.]|nr:hypothetical protein [Pseudogracilibacillus sp.]
MTYETGFVKHDSDELESFFESYLLGNINFLLEDDGQNYYYAKENLNEKENEIVYYQVAKQELKEYYSPVFNKEPDDVLYQLFEEANQLLNDVSDERFPHISKEGSRLTINMSGEEQTYNLNDLNNEIQNDDKLIMNLISLNEEGMILSFENYIHDQLYYFFVENGLTDFILAESNDLDEMVQDGELEAFYGLLKPVGEKGSYLKLPNRSLVEVEQNKVHYIDKKDEVSIDFNYVYINGHEDNFLEVSDGRQDIQTIENYLANNDEYYSRFNINFKQIAKKMNFKTSGPGLSSINYFDEDFIILRIDYDGRIVGTAGGSNVIIDLRENKEDPTAYIVDLDFLHKVYR